jgi:hypothetical protein
MQPKYINQVILLVRICLLVIPKLMWIDLQFSEVILAEVANAFSIISLRNILNVAVSLASQTDREVASSYMANLDVSLRNL